MQRVLPSLLGALDAMREVDIGATSGYGAWSTSGDAPYPSWASYLLDVAVDRPERREHGWRPRLRSSSVGEAPFEEAYAVLRRIAPGLAGVRHLVHSDLLNRNVLVDGDEVSAIFDWGSSIYGDFLYDVAWLEFFRPWYGTWASIDVEGTARRHLDEIGLAVDGMDDRLLACKLHIGLAGQAYTSYRGFWAALRWLADRTLEVAHRAG
jgi:hygromycin-B 4-O-kinase